jgi:hypothetical protein
MSDFHLPKNQQLIILYLWCAGLFDAKSALHIEVMFPAYAQ